MLSSADLPRAYPLTVNLMSLADAVGDATVAFHSYFETRTVVRFGHGSLVAGRASRLDLCQSCWVVVFVWRVWGVVVVVKCADRKDIKKKSKQDE